MIINHKDKKNNLSFFKIVDLFLILNSVIAIMHSLNTTKPPRMFQLLRLVYKHEKQFHEINYS